MNEKFFDMKKDKQDRIINGAMKVFAVDSYCHASTDDMVREAQISKGLLFHYFENKIGIYRFVYEYSVRFLCLEIKRQIPGPAKDYFGLVDQVLKAASTAAGQYPYILLFLLRVREETDEEAKLVTAEMGSRLTQLLEELKGQADKMILSQKIDPGVFTRTMEYAIIGEIRECYRHNVTDSKFLYERLSQYVQMMNNVSMRSCSNP